MHEGNYGQPGTSGASFKGERSMYGSPYHYCSRCGRRIHLSELQWQRGLLLCTKYGCLDVGSFPTVYPLIGQREMAIANAFEVPTTELQPVPKLTDPNYSGSVMEDEVIY